MNASPFNEIRNTAGEDYPKVLTFPVPSKFENPQACCAISKQRAGFATRHLSQSFFVLIVAVTIVTTTGCGELDLGERKWSCNKQPIVHDIVSKLQVGDRLWRFNEEPLEFDIGKQGESKLTIDENVAVRSRELTALTGIAGNGLALFFEPEKDRAESPFIGVFTTVPVNLGSSVTYSLWFSLHKYWSDKIPIDGTQRSVLLSTLQSPQTPNCVGHELALVSKKETSTNSVNLSLQFTHCGAEPIEVSLTDYEEGLASTDSWGLGKWYHVAATVQFHADTNSTGITLYWNGTSLASAPVETSSPNFQSSFYIGSDPNLSDRFEGLIDDVALLQRALNPEEIREFRLDSISNYELNGLRWGTWAAWRSSSNWNFKPNEGLSVSCNDGDSSGCGVLAVVGEAFDKPTKVLELDHVILSGDLPTDRIVDFTLASSDGRQFCKWSTKGIGGTKYKFSVDDSSPTSTPDTINELKWCQCDTCNCDFNIQSAIVSSEWTPKSGLSLFKFGDLKTAPSTSSSIASEWNRAGALGPKVGSFKDVCWRPIAFDATSHARFVGIPQPGAAITASLIGETNTTALLAADFGVGGQFLDLSQIEDFTEIIVCANLPNKSTFQITLQSENGGFWQALVVGTDIDASTSTPYPPTSNPNGNLTRELLKAWSGTNKAAVEEDGSVASFNPSKVRYLGIQKVWQDNVPDVNIRIDSVRFDGDRTQCAKTGTSTGTTTDTTIDKTPDAGTTDPIQ